MTIKSLLTVATLSIVLSSAVRGAEWEDRLKYDREGVDKFPPKETSLDLFGTWADQDRFGMKNHGHWGGGIGLNFFSSPYVGIGADSYIEEWKAPYRVNGSLILRYPFKGSSGLAPYAFGGGGRQWKYVAQWTFHGGVGVELRFNRYTGVFIDARRVFPDKTQDYTLARAGVRLSF